MSKVALIGMYINVKIQLFCARWCQVSVIGVKVVEKSTNHQFSIKIGAKIAA